MVAIPGERFKMTLTGVPRTTGIYVIENTVNGHRYVGSASVSFYERLNQHLHHLRKGKHHNRHLQGAWNTYGPDAFRFVIIEQCPPSICISREQYWFEEFHPEYNLTVVAESWLGRQHTEETKRKIGDRNRGRVQTAEEKAKRALAGTGHRHSEATKTKMSLSAIGRVRSPETCRKLSIAFKGRKLSDEHRANISAGAPKGEAWHEARRTH